MQKTSEVPDRGNSGDTDREALLSKFQAIRNFTEELTSTLETEDFVIQSMPDVSPVKWHLAHTSWFFEQFLLSKLKNNYKSYNDLFNYLFNSYYVLAGERHCRPKRGLISRPTVSEIFEYRKYITKEMKDLMLNMDIKQLSEVAPVIIIGINHEQQHQELILTDVKHVFSENPLDPVYADPAGNQDISLSTSPVRWINYSEGIYKVGNDGSEFGYDNEFPQHRQYLQSFSMGSRLITNREYIEFMEDGGYEKPEHWLSDGWNFINSNKVDKPLYWYRKNGDWKIFSLTGCRDIEPNEPVCHVSFYEADAFARWAGARLPTEYEWEVASSDVPRTGNFVESKNYHPSGIRDNGDGKIQQMFGDVWEWTASPYIAYPGFKPLSGALGEYNGKFMSNQMVLRGGSCATSITHIRNTYRNFFPPDARWQFMGIRLLFTKFLKKLELNQSSNLMKRLFSVRS